MYNETSPFFNLSPELDLEDDLERDLDLELELELDDLDLDRDLDLGAARVARPSMFPSDCGEEGALSWWEKMELFSKKKNIYIFFEIKVVFVYPTRRLAI